MSFYTDSHAHIHMSPLSSDVEGVLKRAYDANVRRIATIGIDLADSKRAVKLAERYKNTGIDIWAAVGVHPHDSGEFSYKELPQFEELAQHKKVIAIGEVGLDFYRNNAPRDKQIEAFKMMLDLAISAALPVIIHTRDAAADTVAILNEMLGDKREHKVLFHCFSGDEILLKWGLERGSCYFSFAGNVTYPKAVELHTALPKIPLDRLLIETDCPYLTPVPHRGKGNEPAFVSYTASYVAEKLDIRTERLLPQLEENFLRLFDRV